MSLAYLSAAFAAHLPGTDAQHKVPQDRADEEQLTGDIIELADNYCRHGYRIVTSSLNNAVWQVNHNGALTKTRLGCTSYATSIHLHLKASFRIPEAFNAAWITRWGHATITQGEQI